MSPVSPHGRPKGSCRSAQHEGTQVSAAAQAPLATAPLIAARALGAAGASLAAFAMDVWIYQRTGSYATFVALLVLSSVTTALLSPWAGRLVDSVHKGRVLVAADLLSLAALASGLVLLVLDRLEVVTVAAVLVALATAEALRWPAFSASLAALTPAAQLARANGIVEAARSATIVIGPLLGVAALTAVGLSGVYAINLLVLCATLWLLRRQPKDPALEPVAQARRSATPLRDALRWVLQQPALLRLLAFLALVNCALAVLAAAQTPYLLSFGSPMLLSVYLALYGAGVLCGGIVVSRWRPAAHGRTIAGCIAAQALLVISLGLVRDAPAVWACGAALGFASSVLGATNQTAWQQRTPLALQGRVFAIRALIGTSAFPLALLGSLPLVHGVIEPALAAWPALGAPWGAGSVAAMGVLLGAAGLWMLVALAGLALRGGFGLDQPARRAPALGPLTPL